MNETSRSRALRLMGSTVVLDTHSHFMINGYYLKRDFGKRHKSPLFWNPLRNTIDLPKLREGRVSCSTFSIYVPPFPFCFSAWSTCQKMLDNLDRQVARNAVEVVKVDCVRDIMTAQRQGLLAALPAVEGAHVIGNRLDRVSALRQRGVRILTLTHFTANRMSDSCLPPFIHGGLSDLGRSLIRACQESGVVVDLTHCSDAAFRSAMKCLTKPPMITHTALRHTRKSQRLVSDEQIREIGRRGGTIGIILSPWHLDKYKFFVDLDMVVDSYCRIADQIGAHHLMIGSDMDAYTRLPRPLRSSSDMPLLCAALLDKGFSESEMKGILGNNALRVLQAWEN